MASRKVAPHVQAIIGGAHMDEDGRGGPANAPEVIESARAELRALLACVGHLRAQAIRHRADLKKRYGYIHPVCPCPACRALARLSRAGRKEESK